MVGFQIYIYYFKLGLILDWFLFLLILLQCILGLGLSANDALNKYILEDSITTRAHAPVKTTFVLGVHL